MSTWAVVLLCGLAMAIGAVVQGIVGIGMALLASPVVTLIEPALVPGSLIICSCVLPALTLIREHSEVDWRGLGWALPFRFAGTAVGAWLLTMIGVRQLGIVMAVAVLGAVAISLLSWRPTPSPANLSVAAFVSGVSGTATSVGGPPIALVYQNANPVRLRCTMSVYFLIGGLVSLGTLIAVGELTMHQVAMAGGLLPFVITGFALALWVRPRVDAQHTRAVVLAISALSAVVLLIRSLA